jgi:hypothetical protein
VSRAKIPEAPNPWLYAAARARACRSSPGPRCEVRQLVVSLDNRALAARILATRTLAPRTLAARTLAARTLAARTVAARTVAAQTVAAQTVAAQTVAAQTCGARALAEPALGRTETARVGGSRRRAVSVAWRGCGYAGPPGAPWQRLYFLPEPQ